MNTRYFHNDTELKGYMGSNKETLSMRSLFPEIKLKMIGSFNCWIGSLDGKIGSPLLPITRIIRHNPKGKLHKCDSRCRNAKRGDCECSCMGEFHGAGH